MSRNEEFLRAVYDRWEHEKPRIGADLELDTDNASLGQCVDAVCSRIALVRSQRRR